MESRHHSALDRLLIALDRAVRTACGPAPMAGRPSPGDVVAEGDLSTEERREAARLMRVNHAGEVAAQALYQAQALTARDPAVAEAMARAAEEENDHLAWCEARLKALDAQTSVLNPVWYAGALAIGAMAGWAGDRWNLGFVAETERQVVEHLRRHLEQLPPRDAKSRAILTQMREDEAHHATTALEAGAAPLPEPVRGIMRLASQVMTRTARLL